MFGLQPFLCMAGEVKWDKGKTLHSKTDLPFIKILEQISAITIKQCLSITTNLEATKYCKEQGLFVNMSKI